MGTYEKAYIYFDTNSLECRHSGKSLYLSQFIVNPIYYEIEDLIRNMGLTGKVEICIPDIVCFELREHLLKHFKAEKFYGNKNWSFSQIFWRFSGGNL